MQRNCYKCGKPFTPTAARIRKSNWICNPCLNAWHKDWRKRRKAAGSPVKATPAPAGYMEAYRKSPQGIRAASLATKKERSTALGSLKYKARMLMHSAIRAGKLTPGKCCRCDSAKTEGHHEDYSKPLQVTWACRKHHLEIHREKKTRGES